MFDNAFQSNHVSASPNLYYQSSHHLVNSICCSLLAIFKATFHPNSIVLMSLGLSLAVQLLSLSRIKLSRSVLFIYPC